MVHNGIDLVAFDARRQVKVEALAPTDGPVVGTIGTLQAHEALKLLAGVGGGLVGRLLMFDGRGSSFDTMRVRRDPACPVCSGRHD